MTLADVATTPDLLRLVAVPVFAWVAVRDIKTRRVSSAVWIPLSLLGAVLLVWDGWLAWTTGGTAWTYDFLLPTAVSLGFVVPIAYLFWWVGGIGGADAKALLVLALFFPVYPEYAIGSQTFPLTTMPVEAFAFTVLVNTVFIGLAAPIFLAVRNAVAGRFTGVMFIGWPVSWDAVPETHGRLLETPDGPSRGGLDLDALRMYLRWRGLTLADVRDDPDRYRDPTTLPDEPNPPTDGAVTATVRSDGGARLEDDGELETDADDGDGLETDFDDDDFETSIDDDPWGAAAFLEDIDGSAYGTRPAELREGLEVLATNETVWISPGTPFLVPTFLGLLVALGYGNLFIGPLL
ncbi:peptidase A24A prepilin type IV [Haloterrigena turkmenica DSM 5511]|uniref:Peptidase A24A prepilin type IV n=1 Tax=Haloterrigena turkmenica (strain ATCC 51198 / DSM 5511 / JCM 9101 / NCIMB 13204 / VKM B-1734 / 4k) TaxID=543526 RepID=D2RTF6_HALTV|nr:A24 family peptidase [Haloterrigena turkmenica]ADB58999.1 peptidase A24A prepilin type IV [Haloterrigena turkmenica DSM 5511]